MVTGRTPPQPRPSRITDFHGSPLVVGVVPGQSPLVALTACSLAKATGAPAPYFAYAGPSRVCVREFPDGTVRHQAADSDPDDEAWRGLEGQFIGEITAQLTGTGVPWQFRYLAGRADRALTHLARAVGAAAFVLGTRVGRRSRLAGFLSGSVTLQLSHRQHRPVIMVPLAVAGWHGRAPWE